MKKYIMILGAACLSWSCEKKEKAAPENQISDTLAINKSDFDIEAIPEKCYFKVQNNDTVIITIDDNVGTILGEIKYNKDSIISLSGFASEDTLKLQAEYSINQDSLLTREIWFLLKFDNLYEGLGERKKDGTYLHPSFLKYEEKSVYKPIDCKE